MSECTEILVLSWGLSNMLPGMTELGCVLHQQRPPLVAPVTVIVYCNGMNYKSYTKTDACQLD
ncbi:hypothetical protein ACB092_09G080800 [Castanea dentata]